MVMTFPFRWRYRNSGNRLCSWKLNEAQTEKLFVCWLEDRSEGQSEGRSKDSRIKTTRGVSLRRDPGGEVPGSLSHAWGKPRQLIWVTRNHETVPYVTGLVGGPGFPFSVAPGFGALHSQLSVWRCEGRKTVQLRGCALKGNSPLFGHWQQKLHREVGPQVHSPVRDSCFGREFDHTYQDYWQSQFHESSSLRFRKKYFKEQGMGNAHRI